MSAQYEYFEKYVKVGTLLDIGFGSARDMQYFKSKGFDVCGIDPTKAFCENAQKLGLLVVQSTIEDFNSSKTFDSIWACASLLHCKDLNIAFKKCFELLNDNGIIYVSMKLGDGETDIDGRYFHYINQQELESLLKSTGFIILDENITSDNLSNRSVQWINVIARKP